MPGPAETLDPTGTFLNYAEASSSQSIWFDYDNQGALAVERARALLRLYNKAIQQQSANLKSKGCISKQLPAVPEDKFALKL